MNNKKYFFVGIFAFALVFALGFVFAISYDLVSSGQNASAGDTVSLLTFNVSNTSVLGENASLDTITLDLIGTASSNNITNVTLSDGTNNYYNDSISFPLIINVNQNITQETNFTLDFTLNSSASWNATFGVNVTTITNSTTNSSNTFLNYDALPYASGLVTIVEGTDPTVSDLQKTSSTKSSITTDFSSSKCSDSGDTASGISSCTLTSSEGSVSGGVISELDCGLSYDVTVTATDNAGNTASKTQSFSTSSCGGGGGSPIDYEWSSEKVHSFSNLFPGVVSIVKNFDSDTGLKEIQIEVINEAQNVKVNVRRYDSKPSNVSVDKSGEVYEYLEIDTENLNENLDNAKIISKVRKSWVSGNGLSRDEVSVFKFDEGSDEWNELTTEFESEDDTYYYYSTDVDSFSYFAISEKVLIEDEGTPADEETEVVKEKNNSVWVWILVILVVLVALRFFMNPKKKK